MTITIYSGKFISHKRHRRTTMARANSLCTGPFLRSWRFCVYLTSLQFISRFVVRLLSSPGMPAASSAIIESQECPQSPVFRTAPRTPLRYPAMPFYPFPWQLLASQRERARAGGGGPKSKRGVRGGGVAEFFPKCTTPVKRDLG